MKVKFFIFVVVFIPTLVSAHGGVSKNVANTIVFLNQSPLSPLAGEKVKFTFALTTTDYQPVRNHSVELALKETAFDDPANDKTLLTKKLTTDQNGDFRFEYTFENEKYFDIDLTYKDPATQEQIETGFLVQVRPPDIQTQAQHTVWAILIAGALSAITVYFVNRPKRSRSKN